jgi:peptidoglycan/xylan/chitin deacetylase (PgdA/CDA1 family)
VKGIFSAPALAALKIPFTAFVTPGFVGSGPLYLSVSELKQLSAIPGATIGAHGARHVELTSLSDADLAEELSASRKKLEDWTGKAVLSLSYPHGAVDRRVREAARKAGFALGGCSRYGVNGEKRDPLLLCRTEVTRWDTAADLRLKLDGNWDWFALRHPDPAK